MVCVGGVPTVSQVRAGLAELGLRSLDELIGRADYLKQRDTPLAKTSESRSAGSVGLKLLCLI